MGDKIVKSKNLCCQLVVFPSLSLLMTYMFLESEIRPERAELDGFKQILGNT